MRIVIFTHSLVSDWNHGNAHFLRGIVTELMSRGEDVRVFEPKDGWSLTNLLAERGDSALAGFQKAYPQLRSDFHWGIETPGVKEALRNADVVIVHEWNSHDLVADLGRYRAREGNFSLFFHDTHHRIVTDPEAMAAYDLRYYDGVLAYGNVIRDLYLERGWAQRAWTWHEAADTRVFQPRKEQPPEGDLVWIGNWGDDERSDEIRRFLIEPVKALKLRARVYGVNYPRQALDELAAAGIEYGGWLPNYAVPEVFARYRVTIHVPRSPYARFLPGIPTIRPFEALACGIPLVSAPWQDVEHLFRPGRDFLHAENTGETIASLRAVLSTPELAARLSRHGLNTITARHTCAHRVRQLVEIASSVIRPRAAAGVS